MRDYCLNGGYQGGIAIHFVHSPIPFGIGAYFALLRFEPALRVLVPRVSGRESEIELRGECKITFRKRGAQGGTRTRTILRSRDFKSLASASSATWAL